MTEVLAIEDKTEYSFSKFIGSLALVIIVYAIAFGAAFGIGFGLTKLGWHTLWITLVADVGATIVVFIFSVIFNNVSFYDPYWSVQPIFIAVYWMLINPATGPQLMRQIIVVSCVSFWGVRLTLNWIRGWKGLRHEDWRYVKYRKEQPKLFWFIAFTGLEMMPTLIVFLGCVAMYPAIAISTKAFNWADVIAIIITIGATWYEFIADEQMKIFCKVNPKSNAVMDVGLWAASRHPNYFAEISFWLGLFFFALAADYTWWWTIAGFVAMVILFMVVSIPMIEKKQLAKRPEYADYVKRVSMIIPWFPKN